MTASSSVFRIDEPNRDDMPLLVGLIEQLAAYEELADRVTADSRRLAYWLFDEKKAEARLFYLADQAIGFVLFFTNFSTFLAQPGLYIEDLYLKPAYRRQGWGTRVLAYLADLALKRGYGRLELSCLHANQSAVDFYRHSGALALSDWGLYRYDLPAMALLAEQADL